MPGKHGGWRGKPGSLAALDPARARAAAPNCARPGCGQPKTCGSAYCRLHGGWRGAKSKPSPFRVALRAARRALKAAQREGRITPELQAQAVWWASHGKHAIHRVALLAAWESRDTDPAAWPRAVRIAEEYIAARRSVEFPSTDGS